MLFAYVDAVVVDTPIVDENYARRITDAHTTVERVACAKYFRLYLDKQWSALAKAGGLAFDWRAISDRLAQDIDRVGALSDLDSQALMPPEMLVEADGE